MLHTGDNQWSFPFVKSYAYVKKHQILSTIGSSNFVEIAINQGNAAKRLGVNIEDDIQIVFS
jgi:S-adenosylmethionine hydrolase